MAIEDYFDSYSDPEDEDDQGSPVECKFCGKRTLYWVQFDNKWKLIDSKNRVHDCRNKPINLTKELLK